MFDLYQFCLFGCVGSISTLLDISTFNLLTRKSSHVPPIPANMISTSLGMLFSFGMNSILVFQGGTNTLLSNVASFLAVNAVSMYVIQSAILGLTTYVCPKPAQRLAAMAALLTFGMKWDQQFVAKNICKCMATCGSLVFNYYCYKYFVFN